MKGIERMAITDEQIKRINELYKKAKEDGLTEEEKQMIVDFLKQD